VNFLLQPTFQAKAQKAQNTEAEIIAKVAFALNEKIKSQTELSEADLRGMLYDALNLLDAREIAELTKRAHGIDRYARKIEELEFTDPDFRDPL
jgi:2-hydroxychromene-2-carboxylate isomerase